MSFDTDAQDYIDRVLAVDGFMWPHVQEAANRFVLGCKADPSPFAGVSNWDAMQCCYLTLGVFSLAATLKPIKGPEPTIVDNPPSHAGPVLGLKGHGNPASYVSTGLNLTDFARGNMSMSAYVMQAGPITNQTAILGSVVINGAGWSHLGLSLVGDGRATFMRSQFASQALGAFALPMPVPGFVSWSRRDLSSAVVRVASTTTVVERESQDPAPADLAIFSAGARGSQDTIAFCQIGEAVDQEALERRVLQYVRDIYGESRRGFPLSRLVN